MNQKILDLLNLVFNRSQISLRDIERACKCSRRQAYRYLNQLSEANIPLYFDEHSRTYRLVNKSNIDVRQIGLTDWTVIWVALQVLDNNIGLQLKKNVEKTKTIVERICKSIDFDCLSVLQDLDIDFASSEKMAGLIAHSSVSAARAGNRKLQIIVKGKDDSMNKRTLILPSIEFRDQWSIIDLKSEDNQAIPLSDIYEVRIL